MLTNTFCHIPHIGVKTEARLWAENILTWPDLAQATASGMFKAAATEIGSCIEQSSAHLDDANPLFFSKRLPSHQHWRLYHEFRDSTAFFDIETTGTAPPTDAITTIALFDRRTIRYYVAGHNLDQFPDDVAQYKLLVTYNGSLFDVPYVERSFGIRMNQAQIDLRFVLHHLGYTGGLKGCERALGISRGELDGVNGFLAVVLWREFARRNNTAALETLLAYNIADSVNLERLMTIAYNEHVMKTPFASARMLPMPEQPAIPFTADAALLHRLKRQYARYLRD